MQFGAQLRAVREARGFTMSHLAEVSGTSKGYISQLESDPSISPGLDVALRLALALETTLDQMVNDDLAGAIERMDQRMQHAPLARCPHCFGPIRLRLEIEGIWP